MGEVQSGGQSRVLGRALEINVIAQTHGWAELVDLLSEDGVVFDPGSIAVAVKQLYKHWKDHKRTGNRGQVADVEAESVDTALQHLASALVSEVDVPAAVEHDGRPYPLHDTLVELLYIHASARRPLPEDTRDHIARMLLSLLQQLVPQAASNLMWALGELSSPPSGDIKVLVGALTEEVKNHLQDSRLRMKLLPEDLAKLIYGYSRVADTADQALMIMVAKSAQRMLPDFSPAELAEIIWAFARLLGSWPPPPPEVAMLIERIPGEVLHQLMHNSITAKVNGPGGDLQADPAAVCKILWAYATLDTAPKKLMAALAQEVSRHIEDYSLEDMVTICWAYAQLEQYPGLALMEGAMLYVDASMDVLPAGQVSCMLWACAAQRHNPGHNLLAQFKTKLEGELESLRPKDVASTLWGFAQLGYRPAADLVPPVLALARGWLQDCSPQDVWDIIWAAAVFEQLSVDDVNLLAGKHADVAIAAYPAPALVEVAEVYTLLGERVASCLPGGLLEAACAHSRRVLHGMPLTKAQKDLADTVAKLGYKHEARAWIEDDLVRIDIVLPDMGVALLLEGVGSYTSNQPVQPVGRTLVRWHLIARAGYNVQTITTHMWSGLSSLDVRKAYIQGLLVNCSAAPSSGEDVPPVGPVLHPRYLTSAAVPALPLTSQRSGQGSGLSSSSAKSTPRGVPAQDAPQDAGGASLPQDPAGRPGSTGEGLPFEGTPRGASASHPQASPRAPTSLAHPPPGARGGPPGTASQSSHGPAHGTPRGAMQQQRWQPDQTGPSGAQAGGVPPPDKAMLSNLRHGMASLSLEVSAVSLLVPYLQQLTPATFPYLLMELANHNQPYRVWQLFDWIRTLPEGHDMSQYCTDRVYIIVIKLCGPWRQLRRGLELLGEMRARNLNCGPELYYSLFKECIVCGDVDLALEVYQTMSRDNIPHTLPIFQALTELYLGQGQLTRAVNVLDEMHAAKVVGDVTLYNAFLIAAAKTENPHIVINIFKRLSAANVEPNSKTFTALVAACNKLGTTEDAADLVYSLVQSDSPVMALNCHTALMAACEKAGLWDLGVALFDRFVSQGHQPDVTIFNSMIAACAHGGQHMKARLLFEKMGEHGCQPDAVTYANLIRAYKKGGQWCNALSTFEAMQQSGRRPHAAVHSSIIDVLWQTGIPWAQRRATQLFNQSVQGGSLPAAAEVSKKGTIKLDLQSLTVGVAVLSMAAWLVATRASFLHDESSSLDTARKVAVVNGLGEHSRAQGHSAAVKEAVGTSLQGCKAPFRLVQDHSRSGRLEASTLTLRKWLTSDNFMRYLKIMQFSPDMMAMPTTSEYLTFETNTAAQCAAAFQDILAYEQHHNAELQRRGAAGSQHGMLGAPPPLQFYMLSEGISDNIIDPRILRENPAMCMPHRKQLIQVIISFSRALHLQPEVIHTAVALMDRVLATGVIVTLDVEGLFVSSLLELASQHEGIPPPLGMSVANLTNMPAAAAGQMLENVRVCLQNDTRAISPVHCLKLYLRRMGCNLSNPAEVQQVAGEAFHLASEAMGEVALLHFAPSLVAAALLIAARSAQGLLPAWPSVVSHMTNYSENATPLIAAVQHAKKLCSRMSNNVDITGFGGDGPPPSWFMPALVPAQPLPFRGGPRGPHLNNGP